MRFVSASRARPAPIVAIQDADLELDPAQIAELVTPILEGRTRVVYGSRFLAGRPAAPWLSIFANQVLTGTTNLLFGGRITDMETCYKVMEREVAQSLKLESNRFDIEPEITAKLLRAGHSDPRAADPLRAAQPRAGQEDRLARWRARHSSAPQISLFKMTRLRQGFGGPGGPATLMALAIAACLATVGVVRGTWAVGGSDSSCYALMATALAGGDLQPASVLANDAPGPTRRARSRLAGSFRRRCVRTRRRRSRAGMSVMMAPLAAVSAGTRSSG